MKIKTNARTDVGKVRDNNEDAYIVCSDLTKQAWVSTETPLYNSPSYFQVSKYGTIVVVADGMGGANAGEVASSIAINKIKDAFSKENIKSYLATNDVKGLLELSVKDADDAINRRIMEDPNTAGMGTTIVICWIVDNVANIAWCGDSRCYVHNPHTGLTRLTTDHSLVQEMVDEGKITMEEAFTHPDSNIITRGLGDSDLMSAPDFITYALKQNDTIILCSDGLCGYCTDKEIEHVMDSHYTDVNKCRDELVRLALDAGGHDNICIALASVIGDMQIKPVPLSAIQKFLSAFRRLLK